MKDKDGALKEYLSDGERFADLFNGMMFKGERVLMPEDLHMLDTNEVSRTKRKSKIVVRQRQRDLVRMVAHNTLFIILGVEDQNEIDYTMTIRQMEYDVMRYASQIKEITKEHKRNSDLKRAGEFLSGFNKNDKIMPVITLTLYFGSSRWDGSLDLYGMIDLPEEFHKLLTYIPNYHINLIEISQIEDCEFQRFCSDLRLLFPLIKYQNDADGFRKYIIANKEEFTTMEEEVYETACVLLDGKKLKEVGIMGLNEKEETVNMCKALDDIEKMAVEKATVEITKRVEAETRERVEAETKRRALQETVLSMLEEGMDVKLIAKITKITKEEVQEIEDNMLITT